MKKKYLLIAVIGLLFLAGCGKKNTLKCTNEIKEESGSYNQTSIIHFDEDGKAKFADLDIKFEFKSEEDLLLVFDDMKEMFCADEESYKTCSTNTSGKVGTVKITEFKDNDLEGLTRDEVIKILEKEDGTKCK